MVTVAVGKERLNKVFIKLLLHVCTPRNETTKIKLPGEIGLTLVTGGIFTALFVLCGGWAVWILS